MSAVVHILLKWRIHICAYFIAMNYAYVTTMTYTLIFCLSWRARFRVLFPSWNKQQTNKLYVLYLIKLFHFWSWMSVNFVRTHSSLVSETWTKKYDYLLAYSRTLLHISYSLKRIHYHYITCIVQNVRAPFLSVVH